MNLLEVSKIKMTQNSSPSRTLRFFIALTLLQAFLAIAAGSIAASADGLNAQLQATSASALAAKSMSDGDPTRGEAIFRREQLGCVKCHLAREGKANLRPIGPALNAVADRLQVSEIVNSVLYPDMAISKGYQSYIVLGVDGSVHQGVLVSKSDAEVVLALPETQALIRIPDDDIEQMQESNSSMPKELANQLASAQEFYDLIRYLAEQKVSTTGAPVASTDELMIRELPAETGQHSLLAFSRPDGTCYVYDPNQFRFDSIWQGPLGWNTPDSGFVLNQAKSESFFIRDKPWAIDVNRVHFDFQWMGYKVENGNPVFRYSMTDKEKGRTWTVEESIEVLSPLKQTLRFRILHPEIESPNETPEVLTYWLFQTNFRNVATNGQQAQRNQLEFLQPGQADFKVNLSRRKSGQTIPDGYSITRLDGPNPDPPFLFEPTGFSFAEDETAYVSTRNGTVWRHRNGEWNLFAEGLHETQGVLVAPDGQVTDGKGTRVGNVGAVGDAVYTMQKPELTLLKDTDGDGVADEYKSVENRFRFTGHYHEFAFGPVMNSSGDLFFSTGLSSGGNHEVAKSGTGQMSSALGYRGWVMKVDPEGGVTPYASGLRSPAGIGMNADDQLFVTDNQGDWVASSYLGHVEKDDFMGHPASQWDREEYGITPRVLDYTNVDSRVEKVPPLDKEKFKHDRKRPAVWLIHGDLTNSPGNPSFCPPSGFGPFEGQAFIADISHRAIVRVALEKVNGVFQGAVFPFIRPLASASYSTRFDPLGRLWVGSVGRGWTTGDPIIEVISFDPSKTPFEMQRIEVKRSGFDIHFTQPLADNKVSADQVSVTQFHYLYWGEYGSDRQDKQRVPVQQLTVSEDRKTLSFEFPVEQDNVYEFDLGLIYSASGSELQNNYAYYTVNECKENEVAQ